MEKILKVKSELDALTSINTAARNVLLAKLAYTEGAIDHKVVDELKNVYKKISKMVSEIIEDKTAKEIVERINKSIEEV